MVARTDDEAHRLADDLAAWIGDEHVATLAERAALPLERALPEHDESAARLEALALLAGRRQRLVVVAPLLALVQRTLGVDQLRAARMRVAAGERIDQRALLTALVRGGYEAAVEVSGVGEFANRGGIVDVWPPGAAEPIRIDLFGDEVESIRAFDPMTQGSRRRLSDAHAAPRQRVPARRRLGEPGSGSRDRPSSSPPTSSASSRATSPRRPRRGRVPHRRSGRGPRAGRARTSC